jgi:hypothetical protein
MFTIPIRSQLLELETIRTELVRRRNDLFVLRQREKILEQSVVHFLGEHNTPGVKCNGNAIVLRDKTVRKKKKKGEKEDDILDLLMTQGGLTDIDKCKSMIKSIMEGQKGRPLRETGVCITTLKK